MNVIRQGLHAALPRTHLSPIMAMLHELDQMPLDR